MVQAELRKEQFINRTERDCQVCQAVAPKYKCAREQNSGARLLYISLTVNDSSVLVLFPPPLIRNTVELPYFIKPDEDWHQTKRIHGKPTDIFTRCILVERHEIGSI